MKLHLILFLSLTCSALFSQGIKRELMVTKRYLNLPVESSQDRQKMTLNIQGFGERKFVIRLSKNKPNYWVFYDLNGLKGKKITIFYPENVKGLNDIYQSDEIAGSDSLYNEKNRPLFHFTTRRGWNNDPNGLVWYAGEYHLFYQHNPYERNWENMHWGHAVSCDLLHWNELSEALYPDSLGTMFSGTAVIDSKNSSGFKTGKEDVMVVAYTADRPDTEVQCIAYSNDKGRTFTKYSKNPVIDTKEKWQSRNLRDPKLFWHQASGKWVMVLFEKMGMSFFNSDNLKDWTFQSHIQGFWECPEFFELAVDKNPNNKKWVLYGASGTYMLGSFDGKTFIPETDKLCYFRGSMYAAQTFNNIPEKDGRRIQIGWGDIEQRDMPFNEMMMFPTEFTLRTTREGIRLFSEPVREIEKLHSESWLWNDLSPDELIQKLQTVKGQAFHLKMKIKLKEVTDFRFRYNGNTILSFDLNKNTLNNQFYGGDKIETLTLNYEILLDRTSLELFADHGKFSIIAPLEPSKNDNGFEFDRKGIDMKIEEFEIHKIESTWK